MIRSIEQAGTVRKEKKHRPSVFGVDPSAEDAGTSLPCRFMGVIFHSSPADQQKCERLGRIGNYLLSMCVDPKHHRSLPIRPARVLCYRLPATVSGHLVPRFAGEFRRQLCVETKQVRICPGAAYADAQDRG